MGWTIQDPTLGIDVDWEDGDDPNRPPGPQDVWNIAKVIRTPYSLSALPNEVKINAAKYGFFETPDTNVYSLLFGETADDPETEIDETEAGIVPLMIEGAQKFARQQLFNVTSARRKLNIMKDRLGGKTIPVKEDDPYATHFQKAGKWLRGLQENWDSSGPFGEWEPKGAHYSQSLGTVGLKDTPDNRRKLIWSALNEDLLQSKADLTQGVAGAMMTGPFVWFGGKKFLRKKLMDDADPQSILDYANAAIEFAKTNYYHEEGGAAVANFLGDEEVVNRIEEGTLAADPEMSLAYMFLLDPMNLAGGGTAKLATSPFRIGLKGQVTKLAVGLQNNLATKIELEAIRASRGSSLLVTRRAAQELAEVNAEIAEQQAKLGRYGGKSMTYNLATLGLRKAPGQVLEAAGESLDLATDAGKQAYKMALEATDAAAQRTFSQLLLGQGFRVIGGTVEAMARTLEWVTRVPENIALSRIMAANKAAGRELTLKEATAELRSLKAAAASGLAGAGLGYYVSETEGILPGAAIAVLTKHLGPAALSKIGSVGRDMKVIGHEYSLARTYDNLARRISKTNTPSVGLAAAEVDRAAALSTEGWFGIPGGVKGATAEVFPKKLPFREGLDTATEGIEAGAKGEAKVVSETTRRVAKFLDDTGLAKAGQVGSTFAGGALKGTAIPAGLGFFAAGGEWEGALTGAVFSAPFTAIGAGAGTYARFRSKGEVYQKLLGDKAYYRDHLTKVEKKAFDSMSNEGQIAVATLSLSNPDAVVIPVNWGRNGAPGSHQVLKDSGESVIRLNVDSPKSLLYALRHESMHHLEAHGLRPVVDSILFGDPLTDKVGFFTKLDDNGNPVKAPIGEDGIQRWELSKEFYDFKEQYMARLRKTEGVDPDSVQKYEEDPTLIGREYFSELGSDLMRTGELQKYLDRGPIAKLFGKVVEAMQGREFTKNLLMKFGIPFDSTGKPLVGSGAAIFKDMKRVPELEKLVKKYANQVKNLRKEEIIGTKKPSGEREGGLAPLDFDQEASHAFSVEDIKDPHVLNILNTGGIFAHNPDGSVKKDAMGNPIRATKKEAENARDPAVDHAISVLEKHGQEHLIEVNKEGKKSAIIHHLSDAMLDDLAAGPLHPRQVQTLRDIAKALREGDGEDAGMLIGYYSATEGRKPKPVSYAIRKAFPISFQITQGGNILVGLLDVARLQKNLTYLKKHFPAETRAFSNDNEVWSDFRTYAKNLANGEKGETGLTGDVANKKNVLNALLGAMKKEQLVANPILDKLGWKRANASGTRAPFGTGYKTFRLDRIFKSERSGKGIKFNQSARERAAVNYMPRQPDDTIPLPFDELPGDKPGEGFGRMINVDKTKSEIAEAKRLADEAQDGFSNSGTVRAKNAYGRDKLYMPADKNVEALSDANLRALEGDKKVVQTTLSIKDYTPNPDPESVALTARAGIVNPNISGMPKTYQGVRDLVTGLVDKIVHMATTYPTFAKRTASFYSDMARTAVNMADVVKHQTRNLFDVADLQLRFISLGSPRSAVAANQTKSSRSMMAAHGHTAGHKINPGDQQAGANRTAKDWDAGKHFDVLDEKALGADDKVRNFYLNGLAELIEIARVDGTAKDVAMLQDRAARTLGLIEGKQKLNSKKTAELERFLEGLATVDMWDMAGKGYAHPAYVLKGQGRGTNQDTAFHWSIPKHRVRATMKTGPTAHWSKALRELGKSLPEELSFREANALQIDGKKNWNENTWASRIEKGFNSDTEWSYYTKADEGGLSPGGGGPLYDAHQTIDGLIADRLNALGLATFFGKKKLLARNAQEIIWALTKFENPLPANQKLVLFGDRFAEFHTAIENLRRTGVVDSKLPASARNIFAAIDDTYAKTATQSIPFEVVSQGKSPEAIASQKAQTAMGAVDFTSSVAENLGKELQDIIDFHGEDVSIESAKVGWGGYTEDGKVAVSPNIVVALRGDPAITKQIMVEISRAGDQAEGNVIRKPTLQDLNSGRRLNDALTFDTSNLTPKEQAAFFLDLNKLKDAKGERFLTGYTETADGMFIGDQYYGGDMAAEIRKQFPAIEAIMQSHNVKTNAAHKVVVDAFKRPETVPFWNVDRTSFSRDVNDLIRQKISTAQGRKHTGLPQVTDRIQRIIDRADKMGRREYESAVKREEALVELQSEVDLAALDGLIDKAEKGNLKETVKSSFSNATIKGPFAPTRRAIQKGIESRLGDKKTTAKQKKNLLWSRRPKGEFGPGGKELTPGAFEKRAKGLMTQGQKSADLLPSRFRATSGVKLPRSFSKPSQTGKIK